MWTCKNLDVLLSIADIPLHPNLWKILNWLDGHIRHKYIITCAYEKRDYPSVHSVKPCRGIDLRCWNWFKGKQLEKKINRHWEYGDGRHVVALYHTIGRGWHLHIQVRNETRFIG